VDGAVEEIVQEVEGNMIEANIGVAVISTEDEMKSGRKASKCRMPVMFHYCCSANFTYQNISPPKSRAFAISQAGHVTSD
jgi:hypothetical protein